MSEPNEQTQPAKAQISMVPCKACGGIFVKDHPTLVVEEHSNDKGEVVGKLYWCKRCAAENPAIRAELQPKIAPATSLRGLTGLRTFPHGVNGGRR